MREAVDKREELKWKWERSPRGEDEEERSCEKGWVSEEDPEAARGLLGISAFQAPPPASVATLVDHSAFGRLAQRCDAFEDFEVEATCNVAVVGSSGCGKSCLLRCFLGESIDSEYHQTLVTNFKEKKLLVETGEEVTFHIWDTPGLDDPHTLVERHCSQAKACILAYASDERSSLEVAERWAMILREVCKEQTILVMARCKDDLGDEVSRKEGQELADRLRIRHFILSVSDRQSTLDMFVHIAKEILGQIHETEERLREGESIHGLQWADEIPSCTAWSERVEKSWFGWSSRAGTPCFPDDAGVFRRQQGWGMVGQFNEKRFLLSRQYLLRPRQRV